MDKTPKEVPIYRDSFGALPLETGTLCRYTCSDIENIYLDLKAGNFEFRTGDSFAVDTMSAGEVKVKSYIANNTWTVEGSKTIGNNENGVVSIIIPKGFHAKKAVMKLTAGNILVSGLSADNTKVEVGMGKCEIKNMYSQHLNMKCGMGRQLQYER